MQTPDRQVRHREPPSRLRPVHHSPLDAVGLPSKGDTSHWLYPRPQRVVSVRRLRGLQRSRALADFRPWGNSLRTLEAQESYFKLVLEQWERAGGPMLVGSSETGPNVAQSVWLEENVAYNQSQYEYQYLPEEELHSNTMELAALQLEDSYDQRTTIVPATTSSAKPFRIATIKPPSSQLHKTLLPLLLHIRKLREAATVSSTSSPDRFLTSDGARIQSLHLAIFTFALRASIYLSAPEHYQPPLQTIRRISTRIQEPRARQDSAVTQSMGSLREECTVFMILDALGRQNDAALAFSLAFSASPPQPGQASRTLRTVRALCLAYVRKEWLQYWRLRKRLDCLGKGLYSIMAAQVPHGVDQRARRLAGDALASAYRLGAGERWVLKLLGLDLRSREREDGLDEQGIQQWDGFGKRGWVVERRQKATSDQGIHTQASELWVSFRSPKAK